MERGAKPNHVKKKPTSDLPLDTQFATLLGSRFRASLCNKEKKNTKLDWRE